MIEQIVPIPMIVAVVELAKQLGLPGRFAPLLSVVLGIATAFYLGQNLVNGLVFGLSAAGLYSGGKASFASKPEPVSP